MAIQWQLFVTPGLGNNSYLLYSEDEAILVDPQRDAWRFLEFAAQKKLRIRYVVETHVHNDYISGVMEVRFATAAQIAAPARGNYSFDHLPMQEGNEIRIGTARVICLETPGHTVDHISWIVYEDGQIDPVVLFSGGSLIVGGAGRTDLMGEQWNDELTRKQFHSIQKLRSLPESLTVLPTHGAGSFCASSTQRKERVTTIGEEEEQNSLLRLNSEQQFAKIHLANLPAYPAYYANMPPINRQGARILKSLPEILPIDAAHLEKLDAWVLDIRDRNAFAEAHIPGSFNIELDDTFGTYAGWIVPFGASIVLILDPQNSIEQLREAVVQLIRIGYESIAGYLKGGVTEWLDSGRTVRSYATGTIQDLCADYHAGKLRLVDVRQKNEWDEGHAKNSVHAFVGDLQRKSLSLSSGDWSVACVSGYRSAIAASILDARGVPVRLIASAGVPEFLAQCPDAKE